MSDIGIIPSRDVDTDIPQEPPFESTIHLALRPQHDHRRSRYNEPISQGSRIPQGGVGSRIPQSRYGEPGRYTVNEPVLHESRGSISPQQRGSISPRSYHNRELHT